MASKSHIHVRQLEIGDFDFVRKLAAAQPNFTVPPPYVLWLLLKIKDGVCLVAEHSSEGQLGYLLAVPVDAPSKALYVWQLAVSDRGARLKASAAMLQEVHQISRRSSICTIAFSAVPGSARYRAIRRNIWNISAVTPEMTGALPVVVSKNEAEYRLYLIRD